MMWHGATVWSCTVLFLAPACGAQSNLPTRPDAMAAPDIAPTVADLVAGPADAEEAADLPDANTSAIGTPEVYSGFFPDYELLCTPDAGVYTCPTSKTFPCRPDSNGVFRCDKFGGCAPCNPKFWPDPAPWSAASCQKLPNLDELDVCVWLHAAVCAPCQKDADCSDTYPYANLDAHCIDYGPEGHFCATFCDHVACPDGYACVPTTGSAGKTQAACRRIDGKCPCPQLPFIGGATECHPVGLPDCTVTRTCVDGVLTPCDAAQCGK